MKFIANELCLEIDDAVKAGFGTAAYIYKEKSRGCKWCEFAKDDKYKNLLLIKYESLSAERKQKVKDVFGNPYDFYSVEPIKNMVATDHKAHDFFINYRTDDGSPLPAEAIDKYTTAANWLSFLKEARTNFKNIKNSLNITAAKFWEQVGDIIDKEKIALPSAYRRILIKLDQFEQEGYSCLVHKLIGKKGNAAKIDCELSEALMIELISKANSDDLVTARRYNAWAKQNNKQPITRSTVTKWRAKHTHLVAPEKYGVRQDYNTYGKHIKRMRPSEPLLLVEHDDNELDLYFKSNGGRKAGSTEVYYFNRFVIAVVIDAYNDYPLGWAIGETYNKELIRLAYLDAMHHIKELTGAYYLPHQIRSDRFGLDAKANNDLGQFYKSLAIFTPATVKVARGKYIERSFGREWHQVLSHYPNYAGFNITAKTKLPQDHVEQHKKDYPHVDKAALQAGHFINILRNLINDDTGLSKTEEWVSAFETKIKEKHLITEETMLYKLGARLILPKTQNPLYPFKISNSGINITINGKQLSYEVPKEYYLETIGKQVGIIYDDYNHARILVTDDKSLRFIATEYELMPSAIADYKPGDGKRLHDRIEEKRLHVQQRADERNRQKQLIEANGINVNGLLQAGIHTKALNHDLQLAYSDNQHSPLPKVKHQGNTRSLDDMINQM